MERGDALLGVVLEAAAGGASEHDQARRERKQAVRDRLDGGSFRPHGLDGPFVLHLGFKQHRIRFNVRDRHGKALRQFEVATGRLRQAIRDYRMIVDAYLGAIEAGGMVRIQAIDQVRRSLHDEAAARLMEQLQGEAVLNHETARRLFTLIYAVEVEA